MMTYINYHAAGPEKKLGSDSQPFRLSDDEIARQVRHENPEWRQALARMSGIVRRSVSVETGIVADGTGHVLKPAQPEAETEAAITDTV